MSSPILSEIAFALISRGFVRQEGVCTEGRSWIADNKVDEMVLALVFLKKFDGGPALREGLHLRPEEQNQVSRND